MQTLWSRAAQAQSLCRCRLCLHTSTKLGLVRRSTTAPPRRKVTGADIFTACYTTLLGAATIIDTARKNDRRRELDERLAKARAALNTSAILEEKATSPSTQTDNQDAWDESAAPTEEYRDQPAAFSTQGLLHEIADAAATIYRIRPRSSWLQNQTDWLEVESAIAAEERNDEYDLRVPTAEQHLERTTQSAELLVRQLLRQCRNQLDTEAREGRGPTDSSKQERILEEVEKLVESPYFPSYENPVLNPSAAAQRRALLSESFRRIFNKTVDAREAACKICYNILMSSTPPNIHNFNTLIAGFNRIQRPEFAESVIDSYLNDFTWPATQQTIVCLLDHATGTRDLEMFRHIIKRMRGVAEDGLHFRIIHRQAIYNEVGAEWVRSHAVGRTKAFVERAPRGDVVFKSLVQGWLSFGRVDVASMSFVACLRNGRLLPIELVHQLLVECLATLDQRTARQMIKGCAKNFDKFERLIHYIVLNASTRLARRMADIFLALFDLCGLPYRNVLGGVRDIYSHILAVFRSLHAAAQSQLRVKEEEESSVSPGGLSLNPSFDKSLTIEGQSSWAGLFDSDQLRDYKSLARLANIALRYQSIEMQIKRIEAHFKVAFVKHHLGHDLDPEQCLPPVDWHTRVFHERYPPLFYALRSIRLDSCSSMFDIESQLLRGLPNQDLAARLRFLGDWENLAVPTLVSFYDKSVPKQDFDLEDAADQTMVIELEKEAFLIEEDIKAILFTYMSDEKQMILRHEYPSWYDMPLSELCVDTGDLAVTSLPLLDNKSWSQEILSVQRQSARSAVGDHT